MKKFPSRFAVPLFPDRVFSSGIMFFGLATAREIFCNIKDNVGRIDE